MISNQTPCTTSALWRKRRWHRQIWCFNEDGGKLMYMLQIPALSCSRFTNIDWTVLLAVGKPDVAHVCNAVFLFPVCADMLIMCVVWAGGSLSRWLYHIYVHWGTHTGECSLRKEGRGREARTHSGKSVRVCVCMCVCVEARTQQTRVTSAPVPSS